MSGKTNLDAPQGYSSVEYKKVLENIQDPEIKENIVEILKNHTREVYIRRLKRCGVVITVKKD